jgi:hypothetical protein
VLSPWPAGVVTGTAVGPAQTVTEGWWPGRGQERPLSWGRGPREHLGQAPRGTRGHPAPHGLAMGPEPVRHLAPRTGLLSPETREGLQAWIWSRIARSGEGRLPFAWRLVARW